jgi:hypothetical protein
MHVKVNYVRFFTNNTAKDTPVKMKQFRELAKHNTFEVNSEKQLKMHIQRLVGASVKKLYFEEVEPE